jgi:hypothetical protein
MSGLAAHPRWMAPAILLELEKKNLPNLQTKHYTYLSDRFQSLALTGACIWLGHAQDCHRSTIVELS